VPPQENVDAMHRCWPRLVLRDLEGYLTLYSSSVIHHGYSSRIRPEVAGLREHYTQLLKGIPDLRVNIEDIIAQGEKVAHRFTFTGANTLFHAVEKYITPFTTRGVASCPRSVSRSKYHAKPSWPAF
jgi:hypothetical protein